MPLLCCAVFSYAQEKEPSHVERFLSPEKRAERMEEEAAALLRANPEDAAALAKRGEMRLRLGHTQQGVDDLQRAVTLDPKSVGAYASLSVGLWSLGRMKEAEEAAARALQLDPNNVSANYYAGRLLLVTGGNQGKAIEFLQHAIDLDPTQEGMRYELLLALRQRGDITNAAVQLRVLRAMRAPNDPDVTYAEGLLATDFGDLPLAIDRFRAALAANPRLTSARFDLGMALVHTGRWDEALDIFAPLAKDEPASFQAAYFHALALHNTHHSAEAEAEARRAAALVPGAADAHTLLGIILSARSDNARAVSELEQAAKLDAGHFDARLYLGRARYALGDLTGARDALQEALKLKPADFEARFFLATVLESAGDTFGALAEYRTLTERSPSDARGFAAYGSLRARTGGTEEAVAALRRARELDSRNFEAVLSLGRLLARSGQFEEAIELLRKAVQRAPDSAEAHYQLGLALRRNGQSQEAAVEFATVERLNREYRTKGTGAMESRPEKP